MPSTSSRSRLLAAVDSVVRAIVAKIRSALAPAPRPSTASVERIEPRVFLSATDPFGSGSHYFDQAPFSTTTLSGEVAQANPNAVGTTDAAVSASGVRYFDGVPEVSATDLSSNGFGQTWGVTRTYSSDMTGAGSLGNHWYLNQLPQLVQETTADPNQPAGATGTIILVGSAYDQRWFDDISGTWTERYGGKDTLASTTYDSQSALVLTTTTGQQIYFYDFSSGNGVQKGQFIAATDPYGDVTSVTSTDGSGDITEVQRANGSDVESWLYTYNTPGGVITNVALRRSTDGGSTFTVVQQVAYAFYTTGDNGGNTGDLESATIEDGAGNPISTDYYRYWLGTETVDEGGTYVAQPADAIKYVYDSESYARLLASLPSGVTTATATEAELLPCAQSYFSYNASGQVYQATIAGQGGTSTGGQGTFTYVYLANTNSGYVHVFSEWATRTTESLPDGNTDQVYFSYAGESILSIVNSGSTLHWGTFDGYDSHGRETLEAEPSAVTLPTNVTTLNNLYLNNDVLNDRQYISDDSGLVYATAFYSSTTATSSTAGGVAGYFEQSSVQQGQDGTAVPQETRQYISRTSSSSVTIYPVATDEVYSGAGGTGGEITSTSYSWFSGTDQPQTMTVTLPTITTGDAPSGSDSNYYALNQYNWVTLTEDGDDYYTATAYDIPTGGITQTITDSGSAGHLNLTTDYTVDGLGRPTEVTSPNGNVTYVIYNDPAHETLTYEGWHEIGMSGNYTSTGPVQVSRTYYPDPNASAGCQTLYFETIAFNPPVESTSTPSGAETIDSTDIQSLTRQLTNSAGQIDEADEYFSLSGITYSQAAAQLGSSSNDSAVGNYYATLYGFDDRGREDHVEDPTGTITDTTFNVLGLPVSEAEGTNDTGSSNMVTTESDYYDQHAPMASGTTLSQTGGSSTGGTTYYVEVTFLGPTGESLVSYESSLLVYSGNLLVVGSPATIPGVTSYNVYVGTTSGAETQQNSSPIALGTNWSPPTSGSTIEIYNRSLPPVDQIGDGNLTESLQYVDTTSSDNRETQLLYDFRDREVAEKDGVQASESGSSINRPIYLYTLNNLDEATASYTYVGDDVSLFDFGNGQPASDASDLRGQVLNSYDAQQRLYQSQQYEVDPTSGSVSATNILTTSYYWDNRNLLVAESVPGGQWLKHQYDGAGRDIEDSTTDGGALNGTVASYSVADTTANDVVVEQTLNSYDADGNLIETVDRQRFDNDPSTSTGDLAGPTGGDLASRDYYTDYYFDAADRQIDEADVGTDGGSAWTRPSSPDADSSTYLLTGSGYSADTVQTIAETGPPTGGTFTLTFSGYTTGSIAYNASAATLQTDLAALTSVGSGNVSVFGPNGGPYVVTFTGSLAGDPEPLITDTSSLISGSVGVSVAALGGDNGSLANSSDPSGNGSYTSVNLAGQNVLSVTGGATPQTIENTYDGDGDTLTTTNINPGSVNQTTAYLYAAGGTVGTNLFANNLNTKIEYPDKTTGLASSSSANDEEYTYNYAGQAATYTDRNGTTHTYTYDVLGREIGDYAVVAAGNPQNVNTDVESLGYSYNVFNQPLQEGSYDGDLSSFVNQVTDTYNGFDQLVNQKQSLYGGVSGSVQYIYSETSNGTENNSRLVATVYPDGRTIDTDYSPEQDSVSSITHSGTTATAHTRAAISGLTSGDTIVIQGASPAAYDGTFTIGTVSGTSFTYTLGSTPGSNASGTYMTAALPSLDQTISRPDGLQDVSDSPSDTVLESYTYLGLNTIVQESHPQTGVDLTYIAQSGDTSAPPAYAATGGDRYVGLDQFGRVDDQFYVDPSSVTSPTDRFQYAYDQNSNLLYSNVVEQGSTASTFSQLYHASGGLDSDAYDGQDRLTDFEQGTLSNTNAGNGSVLDTVASPAATQSLTLDSLGNWDGSSVTGIGTTEARTFNAQNQITLNSGSTTPTYDNDGNVTKDDAGTTYTYTAWNQIATTSADGTLYFQYLPNGPQASVATAPCGGTTLSYSFYSTQWQDLEDVVPATPPATGSTITTYVWGLENVNELVARDNPTGRLYAQHDPNMDVTALVNTSGTVVERFSYTPSGVVTVLDASWSATTDSYNWTFLWQGGKLNTYDGLYSFGYRNYSPTLGTWMEEDPTGYAAGPNVYQAMLGAPIERTDPFGLDPATPQSGSVAPSGSAGLPAMPSDAPAGGTMDTFLGGRNGSRPGIIWTSDDPNDKPDWVTSPAPAGWYTATCTYVPVDGRWTRIDYRAADEPAPPPPPKPADATKPGADGAAATTQPESPADETGPVQPPDDQPGQAPEEGSGDDGIIYVPVEDLPPDLRPDPELPSGSANGPWVDSAGWLHGQQADGSWADVWIPFVPVPGLPNGGLVTSQFPTQGPTTQPSR